jgi:leader peptidase (prepilin peptidase)/N-methyltransferase
MSFNYLLRLWPWWLFGVLVGLWLVPLARIIPRKVLQRAQAPLHEWQGPGGGLEQPVSLPRRIWTPLVNAILWGCAAHIASHQTILAALLWACMASTLVLLALMDWDALLLPDWVVLPLCLAGLVSSHVGFTQQGLIGSTLSATVVLGIMGGFAWSFKRITGKSGIGGGDLKLLVAIATWFGLVGVFDVLLLASLINVTWNLAWRYFKGFSSQAEWPFGPSIVMAALIWRFFYLV